MMAKGITPDPSYFTLDLPVPLRHVIGFPYLGLLRGLRDRMGLPTIGHPVFTSSERLDDLGSTFITLTILAESC